MALFPGGGGNAILWTKRFYGHLDVSDLAIYRLVSPLRGWVRVPHCIKDLSWCACVTRLLKLQCWRSSAQMSLRRVLHADLCIRYSRKLLRGPPTRRVPTPPPQQQKGYSKMTKILVNSPKENILPQNVISPKVNVISPKANFRCF